MVVVVVCIVFTDANAAGFSCDTGTLSDICTVTSLKIIDANDIVSGSGSLVIGSGGELRVATSSYFSIEMGGDITIQSGGKISGNLLGATSTNFTIDIGGMIDVSGKGYVGGTTGVGTTCSGCGGGGGYGNFSGNLYGGGGGYGGRGANAIANENVIENSNGIKGGYLISQGGTPYGSITVPTDLGSGGGGGGASYPGGNGGGAVKIVTSNDFTLNGTIRANGSRSYGSSYYTLPGGGSGGSVLIQANNLVGTGSTTANGGGAHIYNSNGYGGTGGGGRIAVYYASDNSSIVNYAYGGGNYGYGGAGTIYRKANADSLGTLLLDNNRLNLLYPTASTTISSNISFASTTITGGAVLHVNDNVSLDTGTKLSMTNFGRLVLAGTSTIFSTDTLDISSGDAMIDVFKDIASVPSFGEVNIYSGAKLSHSSTTYPFTHYFSLIIGATNLSIANGGSIDVSERGYSGGTSTPGYTCSGCGGGGGFGVRTGSYGGGGGYGGSGANATVSVAEIVSLGGTSYGSTTAPAYLGSGGGGSSAGLQGGFGGGAVKLVVSGTLTNNGVIKADGGRSYGSSYSNLPGGGSGGSIWLQTNILAGTGSTTANGGGAHIYNVNGYGGTGGGGRIAIYYTTDNSSVTNYAYGQTNYKTGGAGTIFKKVSSESLGSLLVDNNRTTTPTHIVIASTTLSSSSTFASTTVTGGALLQVPNNTSLVINDTLSLSNLGGIVVQGINSTLTASALIVSSGSTTLDVNKDVVTPPTFTTATINGNSTLSHSTSTFPTTHNFSLIMSATDLTVNNGGAIDVTGKGFLGGTTTAGFSCVGCGGGGGSGYSGGIYYGGGGSYGGKGSDFNPYISAVIVTASGSPYGSTTEPTQFGSGGGGGSGSYQGGNGGGAMKLMVSGTLTNNGWIMANGGNGVYNASQFAGGGSGGSVWIQTDILAGSGAVTANGGNGGRHNGTYFAGGGGGGRIASLFTTDNSTITYSALGKGVTVIRNTYGGAGTIYKKASASALGDLTLNNGGYQNASTTISSTSNIVFASTTITGGAILHIPNNVTVNAGSSLTMSNFGGLVLAGTGTVFSVDALNIQTGSSTIDVHKDIVTVPTFGDVTINSNSTLSHSTSTFPTAHYYSLIMSATNLTINSGGAIDVSGKGYSGATTTVGFTCSGCSGGGGYNYSGGAYAGSGGGHGGAGGSAKYSTSIPTAGSAYDSSEAPVLLGSGGGAGGASYQGGNGGGAIKLTISGLLNNSGVIKSNGVNGSGSGTTYMPGGGAGGSVWISSGSLSCAGSITANGGNGWYQNTSYFSGGGGGGLVKLSYGSGSACASLTATGGTASGSNGLASDGTVSAVTSPTVTTSAVSSVLVNGATLNGSISATGGANATDRGFAYGLTTAYGATTTDPGSYGTGDFSYSAPGMLPNTTYHFRAYAINSVGTTFGSDQQFVTSIDVPTVSTDVASSITMTSATLNATVGDLGGDSVIDRGFAYGPTEAYTATSSETGTFVTGSFTYDLSSLTCATSYHVRAYASNSTETGYGTDQIFTTSACPVPSVAPTQTNSSGGTVQSRISNLMRLGMYQAAQELQSKWAHILVPSVNMVATIYSAIPLFVRELDFGDVGPDVRRLQEFLGKDKAVYPDGRVTGYFGILTKEATIAYQLKNKIISSSKDRGAGRMGPKTKAFINSVLSAQR